MINANGKKIKGTYFTLHPYVFLVEGKKRGALYDLHHSVIYPLPEAARYIVSLCEQHIPVTEILERIDDEQNKAMAVEYMHLLATYDFGKFRNSLKGYVKTYTELPDLDKKELTVLWLELPLNSGQDDMTLAEYENIVRDARIRTGTTQVVLIPTQTITRSNLKQLLTSVRQIMATQIHNIELQLKPCPPFPQLLSLLKEGEIQVVLNSDSSGKAKALLSKLASEGIRVRISSESAVPLPALNLHQGFQVDESMFITGYSIFRRLKHLNPNSNRLFISSNGTIHPCIHEKDITLGNIRGHRIEDIVELPEVRGLWHLSKDHIDKCKDCEYRYACVNTQLFRENRECYTSRPLNCSYNPYEGLWEKKQDKKGLFDFPEDAIPGEIRVDRTRYFTVYSHEERFFPRDYLELLDKVVDNAIATLSLPTWSHPLTYYYYPSVEVFEKNVRDGVDLAGKMRVQYHVGNKLTYEIHSSYPCHTHEIMHAVLHSIQPQGNYFVQEGAATMLGLCWGTTDDLEADTLKELLLKDNVKVTFRNGVKRSMSTNNTFLVDEKGLISGPLRKHKSIHQLAHRFMEHGDSNISLKKLFHLPPKMYSFGIYELGGSYFNYLLNAHGPEKFRKFYRSPQTIEHLESSFQACSDEIDQKWKKYLRKNYSTL